MTSTNCVTSINCVTSTNIHRVHTVMSTNCLTLTLLPEFVKIWVFYNTVYLFFFSIMQKWLVAKWEMSGVQYSNYTHHIKLFKHALRATRQPNTVTETFPAMHLGALLVGLYLGSEKREWKGVDKGITVQAVNIVERAT